MKSEKISKQTTNRLSVDLRCLNLLAAAGIRTISSQALAEQFNLNSAQIRKDLAYFGEFGVRGVGYFIEDLRQHITKILGLETAHRIGQAEITVYDVKKVERVVREKGINVAVIAVPARAAQTVLNQLMATGIK